MAQGPHIHDWHYGNAERIMVRTTGNFIYHTTRYCKQCKFVEVIKLKTEDN